MRLLGLAKGVSSYGMVRDGLALLSADRIAGGKFMRVIRGVESESEVRELNLAVAGNNRNCGFCCGQMGRWVNVDGQLWEGWRCRAAHVDVERGRAVQRSHTGRKQQ